MLNLDYEKETQSYTHRARWTIVRIVGEYVSFSDRRHQHFLAQKEHHQLPWKRSSVPDSAYWKILALTIFETWTILSWAWRVVFVTCFALVAICLGWTVLGITYFKRILCILKRAYSDYSSNGYLVVATNTTLQKKTTSNFAETLIGPGLRILKDTCSDYFCHWCQTTSSEFNTFSASKSVRILRSTNTY